MSEGVREGAFYFARGLVCRLPFFMQRKETNMAEEKKKTAAPAKKEKAEKKFEKFKAQVVYGNLNIREKPEVKDGNITGVFRNGTVIEILDKKEGWYQTGEGWIMAKYTDRITEED